MSTPWPTNPETIIYVIGFVGLDADEQSSSGGFDWYWKREDAVKGRDAIVAANLRGTDLHDVTDVREVKLDQLALDGNYTPEAITDALNAWPEAWEPKPREGRTSAPSNVYVVPGRPIVVCTERDDAERYARAIGSEVETCALRTTEDMAELLSIYADEASA